MALEQQQENAGVEELQRLGPSELVRSIYIQSKLQPGGSVLEAAVGMGEHRLLGDLLQPYQEAAMSQQGLRKDVHAAAIKAATMGNAQCLRLLLDWDPSSTPELLGARDSGGCTPLIICATQGHMDCMRLLLAHNPDTQVAAATRTGGIALMAACRHQHSVAVGLLLRHSPLTQVAAVTPGGSNALMEAVGSENASGSEGAAAVDAIVRLLLRHSPAAQVSAVNASGDTALMIAVSNGYASCLPLLLAHSPQAQVAAGDSEGQIPLMVAASNGDQACVQHLLAHSPDTQVAAADTELGWTALMHAAVDGRKPCLQLLLEHSPEVQLGYVSGSRWSGVSLAAYGAHVDCLQLLLDRSPPRQQLDQALLRAGGQLFENQQAAPLRERMRRRWTTCVERLLAAGAWTPDNTPKGVVDIVRSINKELAAQALVPHLANEAVVGLAGAVRHQKRPAGEDAARPSKHARPAP